MEAVLRAGVIVAVFLSLLAGVAIRVQQSTMGANGFGYSTLPEELVANFTDQTYQGKVALVTGASSGIGWEIARILASKGFHVVVMARTYPKAESAIARLQEQFRRDKERAPVLTPLACNLGSLAEIEAAALSFGDLGLPLHLLINNAAERPSNILRTSDGFDLQMGVNYFGHMHLTALLLPTLMASQPARVVTVASTLHRLSTGTFVTLPDFEQTSFNALTAYADSKMALIVASLNLHNMYFSSGVSFFATSPGFSSEHLEAGMFTLGRSLGMRNFFTQITSRKEPRHASASVIYVALRAPHDHSGTYFENCNIREPKSLKVMHDMKMLQDFGNETAQLIQNKIRLSDGSLYKTMPKKQASKPF